MARMPGPAAGPAGVACGAVGAVASAGGESAAGAPAGGASGDGAPPVVDGAYPCEAAAMTVSRSMLGAQPGQAVAHGVQAVHGVGEVGLELVDGGAVAHGATIHHQDARGA